MRIQTVLFALFAGLAFVACSGEQPLGGLDLVAADRPNQALSQGESHPYQGALICERAPGSSLVGVMYDVSSGAPVEVARFPYGGNVGDCELSLRASRENQVCVPGAWWGFQILDLRSGERTGQFGELTECMDITSGHPELKTEEGYVEWIGEEEREPFRALLPVLSDPFLDEALHDDRAIWYDDSSAVFVYQDSFGSPKGLRANRVGYDVGSTSNVPDIMLLTDYFQPQKFKFPFAATAGATFAENVYARYFWRPPPLHAPPPLEAGSDDEGQGEAESADGGSSDGGSEPEVPIDEVESREVVPVRIWKNNTHWQWVFPVGTVIGEVLHIQAPDDDSWYVFEVRTRTRTLDGWETGVFRPYVSSAELAAVVRDLRPEWEQQEDLTALVGHLEAEDTLVPHRLEAPDYEALFPPLDGAMDYLPEVQDLALIKELLVMPIFRDTMGTHWKADDALTTFAASTRADFHIVPRNYFGGMFETSEQGCKMCHEHTSRPLNNLDPRVVLYGEVWGEDEIFTWHPFAIDARTFSVADFNRHLNPRLVESGLVEMGAPPASSSETYRALPKPYAPIYD